MSVIRSVVTGVGAYLPEGVLTNDELSRMVDTSDEWIRERTGIKERRRAAEGELTSDLAVEAAKKAMLEKFKNKPSIDPKVAAERAEAAKAREAKRIEAEERRKARVEAEKLERMLAAEAKAKEDAERAVREAAEAELKAKADAEAEEIRAFEQKARRDLKYAARKARQK